MLLKTSITNKCKKKILSFDRTYAQKNSPCINETKCNDTGSTTQNSESETSCNVLRLTEESFRETRTKMVTNKVIKSRVNCMEYYIKKLYESTRKTACTCLKHIINCIINRHHKQVYDCAYLMLICFSVCISISIFVRTTSVNQNVQVCKNKTN